MDPRRGERYGTDGLVRFYVSCVSLGLACGSSTFSANQKSKACKSVLDQRFFSFASLVLLLVCWHKSQMPIRWSLRTMIQLLPWRCQGTCPLPQNFPL
ncbi:MAG: hypothetical protein ACI9I8_002210, partial [Cellvibrionaceae bacterium]